MDALKDALKNKMKAHKGSDVSGDDKESALHDMGIGMMGAKSNDENEEVDRAPSVQDDPMHKLEGGGNKETELNHLGKSANLGKAAPEGHDNPEEELAMLKKIVSGNPQGRSPMSLGERANDKMKTRMSAIQKAKEASNGDAKY